MTRKPLDIVMNYFGVCDWCACDISVSLIERHRALVRVLPSEVQLSLVELYRGYVPNPHYAICKLIGGDKMHNDS